MSSKTLSSKPARRDFSPKAFYFFYYAAFAAFTPFLVLYYEQLGFNGQQIGLLSAVFPLVMMTGGPLWGALADSTGRSKLILVTPMILSVILILFLQQGQTFSALVILVSAFAFLVSPIIPLGDTAVLEHLGSRKSSYGRIRVWGAVGWGLSAPLAGLIVERLALSWAFYLYALLMLGCLLSSLRLAFKPAPTLRTNNLKTFLTPEWLFFLGTVFIGGAGLAVCGNFVYLRLSELQATGVVVGLALTMATLSELPLTFYGKQLLERFKTQHLLIAALVFLSLRLLFYGWAQHPGVVLSIQLLHGFTFSIMWISAVAYADKLAPEGKKATAQGLLGATMMGLGSAFGGLLGGFIYDLVGLRQMFFILGLASTIITAGFIWYIRRQARKSQP